MEGKTLEENFKVVSGFKEQDKEMIEGRFKKLCILGEGTYGIVYKALEEKTEQLVAIKKVRLDDDEEGIPSTSLREISILKELKHPNIVKLLEIIYHPLKKQLYLVFEYIPYDLKKYIKSLKTPLTDEQIKNYLKQLLEGVVHLHTRRIIHRDLKPQNILIDPKNEILKIADFGLARAFSLPIRTLTHEIETLWYRAPEVLLGISEYCLGVDTWPIGCIMAEMFLGKPLFRGDSEIDQIFKILQFLGTPKENECQEIVNMPNFKKSFPKFKGKNPYDVLKGMDPEAMSLLLQFLKFDRTKRINAIEALQHPYFK